MADLLTPRCPLCDRLPMLMLADCTQAFCGNDDCRMFTWNPTLSRSGNLQAADFIKLPPLEGSTDG